MNKTSVVDLFNGNVTKEMAKQVTKSTLSTVQDTVQSGVSKAQEALLLRLGATQELLKGQRKRTTKNLKNLQRTLQKNMQSGLSQTQDVLLTGLGPTQDVLGKNAKGAAKGLKKAQENLEDTRASFRAQMKRRASRRRRAKTMFRLGLLTGIALMLFYAPWPGSETRRRLVENWQRLFPSQ